MKKLSLVIAFIFLPVLAWADGEVLKLNTRGTEYCLGKKPTQFNPGNDKDLWLLIDDSFTAILYSDASLTKEVAVLELDIAMLSAQKASFSAFYGDNLDYIVAVGMFNIDANEEIKSLNATLVRRSILDWCYSKAKVTGKRIN